MNSINILGPFSTGTNLLNNIINEATNIKTVELIHKHNNNFFEINYLIKNNPNILFVVMYRPLFSWVESMKKASYDISWNKQDITSCAILFEKYYDNIVDIYNSYYINYMKLIKQYPNVISIRYYQLISQNISCNYILTKLNPFFCIKQYTTPSFYYKLNNVLKKPSKDHGHSVNNNNEAIKNFFYLQNLFKNNNDYKNYEIPKIVNFFEKY
jgi:hypothetical protein